jgi:hypothetical protein
LSGSWRRRFRSRRRVVGIGIAALLGALACSAEPAVLFVAGGGFAEVIEATTDGGGSPVLRVGEALVLRARRSAGPWRAIDPATLGEGVCAWGEEPPSVEPEVADNLRWIATPAEPATFNVTYRQDHTREVRFSAPGEYVLVGQSDVDCDGIDAVDSLRVVVE